MLIRYSFYDNENIAVKEGASWPFEYSKIEELEFKGASTYGGRQVKCRVKVLVLI